MTPFLILNCIAFISLLITSLLFIDAEHKKNACIYDPSSQWCYTDLFCKDIELELNSPEDGEQGKNVYNDLNDQYHLNSECKSDQTKCKCTDPSFQYNTKCKIGNSKNTGTDSGVRGHCYYGNEPSHSGPDNAIGPNSDTMTYQLTIDNTPQNVNNPTTGQTVSGTATQYPNSYMFCSNPNTTGQAHITSDSPNVTHDSQGFHNWTATPSNAAPGGNLGFSN